MWLSLYLIYLSIIPPFQPHTWKNTSTILHSLFCQSFAIHPTPPQRSPSPYSSSNVTNHTRAQLCPTSHNPLHRPIYLTLPAVTRTDKQQQLMDKPGQTNEAQQWWPPVASLLVLLPALCVVIIPLLRLPCRPLPIPIAGAAVPYSMDNTPSNGNGIAVKRNLFNDSGTAIPGASWCYNHYNYYDYLQFHYIVLLLLLPPLSWHYCCHSTPTTVALHMEALGLYKISPPPHSAIHCCV